MIRSLCLFLVLIFPAAAQAQLGEPSVVMDAPRSIAGFDRWMGYEDMAADRHGTPAAPARTELGTVLVLRMFRNVCLGIERGQGLEDVVPDGLAIYESKVHLMGMAPTGNGPLVLSATGNVEIDEAQGHPWIYLAPRETGMDCQLEWKHDDAFPADRQVAIAALLDNWFPFQMALVPADRPLLTPEPLTRNFTEWDRACDGKWCPTKVNYNLPDGFIALSTTLNITDIQGDRP